MATPSSFRVIQISDTHLVESPDFFLENWSRLVEHINARKPDLVIHTGDVSFEGAEHEAQLKRASAHLGEIDCESIAIPGNHDVGEAPGSSFGMEPEISAENCERFAAHFGQQRFSRDVGAWRLVGINALLLGSGLDAETEEWQHLEDALAGAGERHLALFLHKPLYLDGPGDGSKPPGKLACAVAQRLHRLIQESGVKMVASGHLHEHRIATIEGVRHVWAPSTGFVTDEILSPSVGTRKVGFVQYLFGSDDVEIEPVYPDDMVTHLFLDHPDMYPRFQEAARESIAAKQAPAQDD